MPAPMVESRAMQASAGKDLPRSAYAGTALTLRKLCVRVAVALLVTSSALILAAEPIAEALLPAYRAAIGWLAPEYRIVSLTNERKGAGRFVELTVTLQRPVLRQGRLIMPDRRGLANATTLAWAPHLCLAVAAVLLLAWPAIRPAEHVLRWAAAAPLLAVPIAFDVPLTLVSVISDMVDPGNVTALVAGFMARGGRMALAACIALMAVALAARAVRPGAATTAALVR